MEDAEGGGEPLPTLFYGLLPKPRHVPPPPDAEWEVENQESADAERNPEPRWT